MPSGSGVLVLTQDFDVTADYVIRTLAERGVRVVRLDLSYFPRRLTFTASTFDGGRRVLRHRDDEIDLGWISSVWYRCPTEFDFGDELAEPHRRLARSHALTGVGGLLRATDWLWVNRPDAYQVAELKPYQLRLAKKLGMRVPRTLVTNDPREVGALVEGADRPIVYKSFSGGIIRYPGAFATGLLTTVVGEELTEHVRRVRHTMCMFQEYVDKAYEIRLTVIGNTYFPVVVRSQDVATARVDWRGERETPYGDFRPLPERVVQQVQALMSALGLVYATLDFIVTPSGEHVFLEVNPGGQFMWLKHELGLPFVEHLADLLGTVGPFRRGAVTQIGY